MSPLQKFMTPVKPFSGQGSAEDVALPRSKLTDLNLFSRSRSVAKYALWELVSPKEVVAKVFVSYTLSALGSLIMLIFLAASGVEMENGVSLLVVPIGQNPPVVRELREAWLLFGMIALGWVNL